MQTDTATKDIYDLEVERLTENPCEIYLSWVSSGPLFQFCGPQDTCGCLTMVARGAINAATVELTEEIRKHKHLFPASGSSIKTKHLPVFAEWQRRIDKDLNRIPPEVQQ